MNEILKLFDMPVLNLDRLQEIEVMPDPRSRYLIAITPRSGSSYLCDRMRGTRAKIKGTKCLGLPGEILDASSIVGNMKKMPGRTPDEYVRNAMRVRKTPNQVSGFKASWFQFKKFMQVMEDQTYFADFKYIYLTRRDLAAQAVSLYKQSSTKVGHTNKEHSEEAISKLNALEYDYKAIKKWYDHIVDQEEGWQNYFNDNRISPLCITYEEIEDDILGVLKRIASYVAVDPESVSMPEADSVFKKISDDRNAEWAHRFTAESAEPSVNDLGSSAMRMIKNKLKW